MNLARRRPGRCCGARLTTSTRSCRRWIEAIQAQGLAGSTAIIVSAKHGQSPQDPDSLVRIKDGPIIEAINQAWEVAHPGSGALIVAGTDDDAWQSYLSNTSQEAADFVKEYLWNHSATGVAYDGSSRTLAHSGLAEIFAGKDAAKYFGVPLSDPRHPDVWGVVQVGVVYTGGSKIAEHGGANPADRDVPIVVLRARASPERGDQTGGDDTDRAHDPGSARPEPGRARSGSDRRHTAVARVLARRPTPGTTSLISYAQKETVMRTKLSGARTLARTAALTLALTTFGASLSASVQADRAHFPQPPGGHFPPPPPPPHGGGSALEPGNLLVSRSVYEADPSLVAGSTQLPAGCVTGCVPAKAGGAYPEVWDNDLVDESFGVTSKIFLDQISPWGAPLSTLEVPNSAAPGATSGEDQMVTSFSSKSELALNLSTRGRYVTFMGYLAPVDALDVSNSNTPGVIDPTNPDPGAAYRVVAQLDSQGHFKFTETNAYSGNNGRAAIMDEEHSHVIYTAGNAGNGANPQPDGIIAGAGAQIIKPTREPTPEPCRNRVSPLPSAASASRSSVTRRTRSARTPTSVA